MKALEKRRIMVSEIADRAISRCLFDTGQRTAAAAVNSVDPIPDLPAVVIEWLGQAALLYGVPFSYLVPDALMLPNESIRFFYVDQNWLRRLVDGAVSIGLNHSEDVLTLLETFEKIALDAARAAGQVRNRLRGRTALTDGVDDATLTGFLFRSEVVSGWPGLEVSAFPGKDRDPADALKILRMDRLSSNVLLVIFEGVPQRVDITEPPEGLHFGVIADAETPPNYSVILRGLGFGGHPAGIQFTNPAVSAPISKRVGAQSSGVLNISQSAANLKQALEEQNALNEQKTFTSAGFAIQMVRAAGMQSFISETPNTLPG